MSGSGYSSEAGMQLADASSYLASKGLGHLPKPMWWLNGLLQPISDGGWAAIDQEVGYAMMLEMQQLQEQLYFGRIDPGEPVIESLMELLLSVRRWNPRVLGMDDDAGSDKVRARKAVRLPAACMRPSQRAAAPRRSVCSAALTPSAVRALPLAAAPAPCRLLLLQNHHLGPPPPGPSWCWRRLSSTLQCPPCHTSTPPARRRASSPSRTGLWPTSPARAAAGWRPQQLHLCWMPRKSWSRRRRAWRCCWRRRPAAARRSTWRCSARSRCGAVHCLFSLHRAAHLHACACRCRKNARHISAHCSNHHLLLLPPAGPGRRGEAAQARALPADSAGGTGRRACRRPDGTAHQPAARARFSCRRRGRRQQVDTVGPAGELGAAWRCFLQCVCMQQLPVSAALPCKPHVTVTGLAVTAAAPAAAAAPSCRCHALLLLPFLLPAPPRLFGHAGRRRAHAAVLHV